ncbi:MAG: tyrosine-protein phosphatase, partial [Lachnospiraceae bacterium]|nr:tyrosine-protein phosphatase [Lachnospiraceae bacterium]
MRQKCSREIALEGVLNVRELGGLPLQDGRMVAHGRLIRTGRLSEMTEQDKKILLDQWHVTTIVDLRNDAEVQEHPDPELGEATYHQVPIFPGIASGISKEDGGAMTMEAKTLALASRYSGGRASQLLEGMYPKMVTEEFCIQGIRTFFEKLLEHGDGALIWHCTSGKDRTGLTGALLL